MTKAQFGLLTFGVFLLIVAVWVAALILEIITTVPNLLALIVMSYGAWTVSVAGFKASRPREDAEDAFSTFGWGMLFIVIGGSWYLSSVGLPIEFSIVFVLLLLGFLAVIVALRSARK